jgi:hypothetical protein
MGNIRKYFQADFLRFFRFKWLIFVFMILAVYLAFDGLNDYQDFKSNLEISLKAEQEKVSQYKVYSQYGGFGSNLFYSPPPFSILTNRNDLYGNVNAADRLSICKPQKGRSYFTDKSRYMSFYGICLLIGVIVSLLDGFSLSRKRDYITFISRFTGFYKNLVSRIFSRLTILYLAFLLFCLVPLTLIYVSSGVNLFSVNVFNLFLVGCLTFTFFFITGVLIGTFKEDIKAFSFLGLILFLFLFAVPWTMEKFLTIDLSRIEGGANFELENLRIYAGVERKLIENFGEFKHEKLYNPGVLQIINSAIENEYQELSIREQKLKESIKKAIDKNSFVESFIPTSFYMSVCHDISNTGGTALIDFFTFCEQQKKTFLSRYFNERFVLKSEEGEGKIKPVFQGNESILFGRSKLPKTYGLGLLLLVFYIMALFLFTCSRMKRFLKVGTVLDPKIVLTEAQTLFVLCKDHDFKQGIADFYQQQENAAVIEKINPCHFPKMKPGDLVNHLASITGVERESVHNYLEIAGVNINTVSYAPETIKIICLSIILAANPGIVVFNGYLKQESKDFEGKIKSLIVSLEHDKKRIVYLSCDFYETTSNLNGMIKIDSFKTYPVTIDKITLR